ncbi:MAG: CvpA family protein [Gammaproteobacteria bacterium]|nr:CvpA family protein [Gammaproteobacteria bacterium]
MAEGVGLPSVLDWVIVAVALMSVIVGAVRGLFREALSLVIWAAALIMAALFADPLSASLERWIEAESLRYPLAFAALFVGVLLLGAMVQHLVGLLVEATGLSGLDRVLGMLFGLLRAGVLLVVLAAVLEPMFAEQTWWQQSQLLPHLLAVQEEVIDFLRQVFATVTAAVQS